MQGSTTGTLKTALSGASDAIVAAAMTKVQATLQAQGKGKGKQQGGDGDGSALWYQRATEETIRWLQQHPKARSRSHVLRRDRFAFSRWYGCSRRCAAWAHYEF